MTTQPLANHRPRRSRRWIGWTGAVLLFCAPLIAMQFTDQVQWDETDFIVFAAMLAVVGLAIELAVKTIVTRRTRWLAIGAALFCFFWLWAELAVGVFTDWGS